MAKTKQELHSYNRLSGREYDHWNGENHVNFLLLTVNVEKPSVTLIQSYLGKISNVEYELRQDEDGEYYFEYGVMCDKIRLVDFVEEL